MVVHFFGTGSGTRPFPGYHHTSFAIETENGVYWFDAGENCSYTAHLMGVDLLRVRAVFISHCHMDHVGGLGNLLWNIRKLSVGKDNPGKPVDGNIDVYIPVRKTYDGVMDILKNTEGGFSCKYTHTPHIVRDGHIYTSPDGEMRVTAVHNHHLAHMPAQAWKSFSYIIEAEGKTVVYSGDFRSEDIPDILPDRCDVFLAETGHNSIADICTAIKRSGKDVEKLILIHHSPTVMKDPAAAAGELRELFGVNAFLSHDAQSIHL